MIDNPVLRIIAKIIIPMILLFALYVQFHGDFGPGGGFQAGVIFAAGFILYGLVFGTESLRSAVPPAVLRLLIAVGLALFAGVGVITMLAGSDYLAYNALSEDPIAGQHLGILVVEFGVGVTVSAVMITIFLAFAGRNDP
ncbi:MAG: cation:proton antiporter [Acidiferrobacteraceae bacterium]|jgi:multicomponent Na+:H+ antiporter subunit B|nr:cation:proton antiporter [Acidiferrobacteraceae bacterium]MDP6551613.1 Na(+)/H(+) antiporter subunit B [Arenicellales bacterium]MDP6790596.1 Na(+)/H(+) antiporter subunit B [Arenicellales bacterium]MDP6919226.1 Na(+)/H(+) antiporter subunit B [Arenicellales bacterium]HCY12244.1 cation:proton antiporter [Gammaproteobacteria bacterium]|tara:strand:+ start:587 stop:1006 length:420 start_codon:yes stop_codon:yes gene_type:complete